jgi:hypothetical protein
MPELTDDERTVLMIAQEGESLAAIGRWEQPIEHLVELGYLERLDKFNNTITPAGKAAISQANDEIDKVEPATARALIGVHNARVVYRKHGEDIAAKLVGMAKAISAATGDEPMVALQRCVAAVRDRAIELLQ